VIITKIGLRNFRRLEDVEIAFDESETVFVGPNNSGKTSATTAFRLFINSPDFKIHDFSVSQIDKLNSLSDVDVYVGTEFPSIEMDIWFSIDPDIEFGRVSSLLTSASTDLKTVGMRMKYEVKDGKKLKEEYDLVYPANDEGTRAKKIAHFLSLPGNLSRNYGLKYFALEEQGEELNTHSIEPEEGRRTVRSLIRIDFVDAQRNIDDQEAARSNKLSSAFADFYKKNLEQAEVSDDANKVIDANNENLNQHYLEHFSGLMEVIQSLGVPSVNDRQLKIISSLSPEVALKGNTSLLYIDTELNHELPEAYNGLGFKNLIYMAIQVSHFHLQWMNTEKNRPLCQLIFIEEPEAHLHAQVQQTFITNIWEIVRKASVDAGEEHMIPQIGITTHSSHILDTVDFNKVRYFRRCQFSNEQEAKRATLNASKVLNLSDFKPDKQSANGELENTSETLAFLKKYLKLTHCDLFFADAVIMVEGTVEKILMPSMMKMASPGLKQVYLTILEVGGAYAHKFASLLEFIGIHYLVITDIDSVDPANNRSACRTDTAGAVSSNAAIKFFLGRDSIVELSDLDSEEQKVSDRYGYISYQKPSLVEGYDDEITMHGRTLEETFIYENINLFRDGRLPSNISFEDQPDYEREYSKIYEAIKSSSFKKTEFALDVSTAENKWAVPQYILEGLVWLERETSPIIKEGEG